MTRRAVQWMRFPIAVLSLSLRAAGPHAVLTLTPEHQQILPGEPAIITLTVRNLSTQDLVAQESNPEEDCEIFVKDRQGREASLTNHGKFLRRPNHMVINLRNTYETLKPGAETSDSIDVAHLYDLRQPGTYLVTAVKDHGLTFGGKPLAQPLRSNPVEIEVRK